MIFPLHDAIILLKMNTIHWVFITYKQSVRAGRRASIELMTKGSIVVTTVPEQQKSKSQGT